MFKTVLLSVVVMVVGCTGTIESEPPVYSISANTPPPSDAGAVTDVVEDPVVPEEDAGPEEPVCVFAKEDSQNGIYVDGNFKAYEMTVEYEDRYDQYKLSAYEIAELANWMMQVHLDMDLPNPEKTYEILRRGHWVVVDTDEIFNQLYAGKFDPSTLGAFITAPAAAVCWETPGATETNWSSAVRARYWDREDVWIVVHEMTHMLSLGTYGESDGDHSRENLWKKFGEDTLMMNIINIHDRTYFPARFVDVDPPVDTP